jgi:hypothetical protein
MMRTSPRFFAKDDANVIPIGVVDDRGSYPVGAQTLEPIVRRDPRALEPQQPPEHPFPGVCLFLLHSEAQAGKIVQEDHLYSVPNAVLKQLLPLVFLAQIEDNFLLRQVIVGHQMEVIRRVLIQQQQSILHRLKRHLPINVQCLPRLAALPRAEVFPLADQPPAGHVGRCPQRVRHLLQISLSKTAPPSEGR